MEDIRDLFNANTTLNSDDKITKQLVDIFLEKFSLSTDWPELVKPPQFEGLTVNDWLDFFVSNRFIFILWLLAMVWVCYVIFYKSRLVGYIITKIVNCCIITSGYFKIGSFSFASISGRIMFRDLVYVTEDYSIRVKDGWIVFAYWIPYVFRNAQTDDLSNSDARVLVMLNGFELHIYNRSQTYSKLAKLFNLPFDIFGDSENQKFGNESAITVKKLLKLSIWRDLIPVTRIEITCGRFVFGNRLIPSTLVISFGHSHFNYTSRPALSPYDLFSHILNGKARNFEVYLVPSPKYLGFMKHDKPLRSMDNGFIVFRSNEIDIYYYQDETGFVETVNKLNDNTTPPGCGMVIKCGKETELCYDSWADRQRDSLYNFFYPQNYQMATVSDKKLKVAERRSFETFDLRLSTLYDAKIDILFCSKNKQTNALHIKAGPGANLELSVPWVCGETGYTTHFLAQMLKFEATTSCVPFRPLILSETLEIDLKVFYPQIWNAHQEWNCAITAYKATIDHLIFAHQVLLRDLIDDWKKQADIFKFIPHTWHISIEIQEFELIVLANEPNKWIDQCSALDDYDENCKIAICGERFDMAFDLPFIEFLPPKLSIKIWIQAECLEGAIYFPECITNINRDCVIELLKRYSTLMCRDDANKWRNVVSLKKHWNSCMSAPIVALSITYDFWPIAQSKRIIQPANLAPDVMTVELEIGPMNLAIFGSLLSFVCNIKQNYQIKSQLFNEMSSSSSSSRMMSHDSSSVILEIDQQLMQNSNGKSVDPRLYRPFEVIFSATLHQTQCHLVECTNESELPQVPVIYIEKLCFELHQNLTETKLIISPTVFQLLESIVSLNLVVSKAVKLSTCNLGNTINGFPFVVNVEMRHFVSRSQLESKGNNNETMSWEYEIRPSISTAPLLLDTALPSSLVDNNSQKM